MRSKVILSVFVVALFAVSCSRRENAESVNIIKEWSVPFASQYVNPALSNRPDTGRVHITLLEDSSIRWDLQISNFKSGDAFTGITLNAGDPVTNGPVILNMMPRLGSSTYITGSVFHLRASLMDSLLANSAIYFNVTSSQAPAGVLRGQLNSNITLAGDVVLTGTSEVPPVTTTARGLATIRMTADRMVYCKVTVTNLEPTDVLVASHIHSGAPGQNGPVLVHLADTPADFGVQRIISVDEATYNTLLTNPLYVNVHTTLFPNGKLRGQLKL